MASTGTSSPRNTRQVPRYSETARGKREKFKNLKLTCFRKANELKLKSDVEVLVIIKRRDHHYIYTSEFGSIAAGGVDLDRITNTVWPLPDIWRPDRFANDEATPPPQGEDSDEGMVLQASDVRGVAQASPSAQPGSVTHQPLNTGNNQPNWTFPPPPELFQSPTVAQDQSWHGDD